MPLDRPPVFRFAPSPNGALHLGHALSALVNQHQVTAAGGRLLLRMEDIDLARCRPEYEAAILDDLGWLGLSWEQPVRRQSDHFDTYRTALDTLRSRDLAYPAFLTRGEVKALATDGGPCDPDGAPLYPPTDRLRTEAERRDMLASGKPHTWRLDMGKALAAIDRPLTWSETGVGSRGETGTIAAAPAAWGDIVLMRPDGAPSYHLAVTLDDALQGVTDIVRGRDLFHATAVHRLLQTLFDLPEPAYHHHRLMLGTDGRKLSKSNRDTGIGTLRTQGWTQADISAAIGEYVY